MFIALSYCQDSPSQKLIFHNEMIQYREMVREFYRNVKDNSQPSNELRNYLTQVNQVFCN